MTAEAKTVDEQMQEISDLRETNDQLKAERERLSGRIETEEKVVEDLEKKCKEEFKCGVDGLQKLIDDADTEAAAFLKEAEQLLEGTPSDG